MSALVNVRAVFSEAIQPATLSMVLRNASNQVVASQVTYDAATTTATLDPNAELAGSQQFTVQVSGARDLAGNQMTAISWSFTTAPSQFVDELLPQTGLTQPTVIEFASDGRLFVAQKDGRIWAFDGLTDSTPTLVADLRLSVYNFWDRGMLGMALHPSFPTVPYVYVLYTYDAVPGGTAPRWGTSPYTNEGCPNPPGATGNGCVVSGRLSRLDIGNPGVWPLTHNNEQVLVTDWPQQFPSHSTGALVFGADGSLYASGGDGASFNYADWGQTSSTPTIPDPVNEGGALRSQDVRTSGDPVTLNGAVIRIDPDTGAALPDNPRFVSDPDPNGRRIVAHGFRNPFRITTRPGTREVWVGDVGWGDWEEINRIVEPIDPTVDNFGWPCYEGTGVQGGYDAANLPVCENLYSAGTGAVVLPHYTYSHAATVLGCGAGSSSISGLAFYPTSGGTYPPSYQGALFFADYSRSCIWAMRPGGDGLPNAADIVQIQKNSAGPVGLTSGPGGDIFYPGFNDGGLHRLRYSGNLPPTASISTDVSSGLAPLTVSFSATSSTDPENGALTYAWDLDGDGAFDDGFAGNAQWTYTTGGVFKPRVLVTDAAGLADVAATTILVNNSAPTAVIDTPSASTTWRVGNTIAFTGHATDPDQPGGLPASALTWEVVIHHCPSNCHLHSMQSFVGVASGSFAAPDHEYPSFLELRLTATDATGLQHTASIDLHPQTVALTFQSNPSGLQLAVNALAAGTPFSRTVIIGSSNSVSAAAQQMLGEVTYQFTSWSDGLSANHNVVAPAVATTYTANYAPVATSNLVAAYGMNESSGTTVSDWTAKGHTGTVSGAAWTASGKFGGALSFDGVNDWVTVNHANDLDFTTAMTMEAWVYPTASGGGSWRTVLIKERPGGEVYDLYSNADTNAPVVGVVRAADPGTTLSALGTSTLPLNTWSHVAATYDGTTLRMFVNGALVGSRAVAGPLLTSTGVLRMGGNSVWGEYFAGHIDEVRLYNRALAVNEIQADMAAPIGTDTTPPARSNGQPTGTLPAGTTQTTLSLTTNENATCRYATSAGVPYGSMTFTFAATGSTSHSTGVTGLVSGGSYTYYVRCQDGVSNSNPDDFLISFSVAQDTTPPTRSNGQPSGILPAGTTQTTLSLTTDENATCRFGPNPGTPYASLPQGFAQTGGQNHATLLTGLVNGTAYAYYIRCQDTAANVNLNDFGIAFSVAAPDSTPPTVSITAPANGATVAGLVTVSASASDNVGVVGVQFLLNGAALGAEDTTAPYSINWSSTSVANGPYQLSARARDAASNQTTAAVVGVTVNNAALPGLVASYSFENGAGTTATDVSGRGHPGTISGATWTSAGRFGNALVFDGVNDWVTVGDANDLDLTTGMTLEAWVYPTALGSGVWRNVVIKERTGGEVYNLYANDDTSTPTAYVVRSAQPKKRLKARGTSQLPLNTWSHLAVTFDNVTLRIFVDGVQVGTRAVAGPLLTSTGALRLGGNSIWGEYFAGMIDEVRIYDRALTAAEIQSDMNKPLP